MIILGIISMWGVLNGGLGGTASKCQTNRRAGLARRFALVMPDGGIADKGIEKTSDASVVLLAKDILATSR
jgi:hypothetical protein